jgi:putative acetyltransferase
VHIIIDDPERDDVYALLEEHLRDMHAITPAGSVHALDVSRLKVPAITFWSVRDGGALLGCGALKELDPAHGELKSMRTADAFLRQGVAAALRHRGAGRAMIHHIIAVARERGYARLSLETGASAPFLPARRLYESVGFVPCGPFGDYTDDPHSAFLTLAL